MVIIFKTLQLPSELSREEFERIGSGSSQSSEVLPTLPTLLQTSQSGPENDVFSPPEPEVKSLEERRDDLERFQLSLLNDNRKVINLYEELFARQRFDYKDFLFQSWLVLKHAAVRSEDEAFDQILKSRLPQAPEN